MKRAFDFKVASLSTLVGVILVLLMVWLTGNEFGTPVFPFMAILSAYIIAGMVTALVSKGDTIAEPGVAAVITGFVTYFFITSMNFHAFEKLSAEVLRVNIILLTLNGILLALVGAWAGEKFQLTFEKEGDGKEPIVEWAWIAAGTIFGVTVSIFLSNLIIKLFGLTLSPLYISLAIGIFITGWVVGLRSPGETLPEAGIAGVLTAILNLDIFKFTLDPDTTSLTTLAVLGSVVIGLVAGLIGGAAGEKMQEAEEA